MLIHRWLALGPTQASNEKLSVAFFCKTAGRSAGLCIRWERSDYIAELGTQKEHTYQSVDQQPEAVEIKGHKREVAMKQNAACNIIYVSKPNARAQVEQI